MDTFAALSDPTRRRIVELLAPGESSFGDIAAEFSMSKPAVSQHLKVLKDANIVAVRADAQRRLYRLNDHALDDLAVWVQQVRRFWSQSLDNLEQALTQDSGEQE